MPAWGIYGYEWVVDQLRRSIATGRVRHAYLIAGPEAVGRETLARAFAMSLNCLHDDIGARPCGECRTCRQIQAGGHADLLTSQTDANSGLLRIEEVRTLTGRVALKPYDARYRIAILRDFDRAQPRTQDALLKTLEEPPPHALLLLIAQSLDPILPTITSRSQVIHLRPLAAATIEAALIDGWGAESEQAALLARLSGGRMGWAVSALGDVALLEQRDQALDLLESMLVQNRAGRFSLAEDLSKEKLALPPLLVLWQSYWRDLLHLCAGSGVEIVNRDRAERLSRLAVQIDVETISTAMLATNTLLETLHTNANARLALEVMLLDYPRLALA